MVLLCWLLEKRDGGDGFLAEVVLACGGGVAGLVV
jgi:hypothetical protein